MYFKSDIQVITESTVTDDNYPLKTCSMARALATAKLLTVPFYHNLAP